LREQLECDPQLAGLAQQLAATHPHLFSQTAVFLDPATRDAVAQAVAALDRVMALPAWQAKACPARDAHCAARLWPGRRVHGL
jgi:hypothetical protein